MNKKKNVRNLLILTVYAAITGCATTAPNVARYDDEYYRQSIIKSENNQQLKEYLTNNNIRLNVLYINITDGSGLRAVVVDGTALNFVTDVTNKFVLNSIDNLVVSGLSGVVTAEIEQK